MAEKTVAVRLTARIDAYRRAMRDARKSTDDFANGASRSTQKLGSQMKNVGRDMSTYVTAPLVGAGVAAVKLSSDFNSAFAQMVGLAGVAAEDVDGLKESVLDLAGATARAPQELAEALYFAASAGLDTQQAMDAVTIAAKAATSGMGTTQDIVGLAASAIASYGRENINAAEATDILVSTIREGRAEPEELAGTLGRVLPIAAQLGVEFDEVGGTVAVLSNVFGDTNRTVTATNGLFVKLLSPTKQGREALADMGTSVEELHGAIDQNGLLGALELLKAKGFDTNATALRALFDDIEGFQAASALLATDQETLASTFGATADATGSLETAFGAIDEDAQALKQAWVDLQVALIQVGDVLGPIVADIAGGVSSLASLFASLPTAAQQVVVGFGAIAAAAGPALMIGGSLVRNYQQISTTWSTMGRTSKMAAGAVGGVGIALTAATLLYASYSSKKQEATRRTEEFTAALEAEAAGQKGALNAALARNLADLAKEFDALGISAVDAARFIMGENVPAIAALMGATDKYAPSAEGFKQLQKDVGVELGGNAADFAKVTGVIGENRDALAAANRVYDATKATIDGLAGATDTSAYAAKAATYEQELLARATTATGDAADETTLSEEELAEAEAALEAQIKATAEAQRINAERSERAREEHEKYVDSILSSLSSLFDHEQSVLRTENAYMDYTEAVLENAKTQGDAEVSDRDKIKSANDLRLMELDLAGQVRDTASKFAEEAGAVEGSRDWADLMTASLLAQKEQYPEMVEEIDLMIAALGRIPAVTHAGVLLTFSVAGGGRVTINTEGDLGSISTSGRRAHGGSTLAGHKYEVLEQDQPELYHERGKTYLMAANDGYVTPMPAMAPVMAAVGGGGGGDVLTISELNVYTYATNGDEFAREVFRAIGREQRWNGNVSGWGR